MPIKKLFVKKYREAKINGLPWLSKAIKRRYPDSYSLDEIHERTPFPGNGTRCDYIVLCKGSSFRTWIYLIESKGNGRRLCKAHGQLKAGAKFVADHLQSNESFVFLPVVVAKGLSSARRKELLQKKVRLCQMERGIEHVTNRGVLPKIKEKIKESNTPQNT